MTKPVVLNETPINICEVKESLKAIQKRDEELNFRAAKTQEYLEQFVKIKKKQADELFKKIEGLEVPRLKPEHIHKIIDILPIAADEVKIVLQGYTITVTKENISKIADTVKSVVEA